MSETTETTAAPVVSIVQQKGGVGKTTLTIHLAGALAERGHDVLVVDLEPEGALTSILGFDEEYSSAADVTLHELLLDPQKHAPNAAELTVSTPEFDVLPAHERMVDTTTSELESEPRARERLGMALEDVREQYDVVLVDNEPQINVLTDNALRNADGVIIPTYAEGLSVQGFDRLQKQIEGIESYYGAVNVIALVINRIEENNQAQAMVDRLQDGFGDALPVVKIRKRVALQRTLVQHGESIIAAEEQSDMEDRLHDLADIVEDEHLGGATDE